MKTIKKGPGLFLSLALFAPPMLHAQTEAVGGNGGTPFNVSCAANEVLVGLATRTGSAVNQVGAYCVSVNNNGQWSSSTVLRGGSFGGNAGNASTTLCPSNHAVVGFNGSTGLNAESDKTAFIQLRCGKLETAKTTTTQMVPLQGLGAATSALTSIDCEDGIAANGIYGRSSSLVDQFGLNCHTSSVNKPGRFGAWSEVVDWPLIGIHAVLTPQGEVLTFGTDENGVQGAQFFYDVWSPSQGTGADSHFLLNNSLAVDSFCSAPILMPDNGNILMPGGDQRFGGNYNTGIVDAPIFNTTSKTLGQAADMSFARWYPTSTVLQNGEVLVTGGIDGAGAPVITPEIYSPESDSWRSMFGATSQQVFGVDWWYPHQWVRSDGSIFGMSGGSMYYIDVEGSGETTYIGTVPATARGTVSTSVMYEPGKILKVGGGATGTGAFTIDVNGLTPSIQSVPSVKFSRSAWSNSSVLPDGTVLVTGASSVVNTMVNASLTPELWNPVTNTWEQLASAEKARLYHSTSLLLPDGRVLITGGGAPGPQTNLNAEIFSPPYLLNDQGNLRSRIQITQAPQSASFNSQAVVNYSGSQVQRVTLIKTGAVTHSFNMEQRFVDLDFNRQGNQLTIDMPDVSLAPPGYYMLFLLDANGTPSVARIIKLSSGTINAGTISAGDVLQGSVAEGEWKYFEVTDTQNFSQLSVTLTGLTADIDLYSEVGSQPDLDNYTCRSWNSGAGNELCVVTAQGSVIGVYGYRAGDFTLSVEGIDSGSSDTIAPGDSITNTLAQDQWQFFTVSDIQSGATVSISLDDMSADLDLYVRENGEPTLDLYDCRSWNGGPDAENCVITSSGGNLVIGVHGYRAGTFTLTVEADDGGATDGQTTDGQTTDGQTTDGQTTDGQTTDGQTTDGGGNGSIAPGETVSASVALGEWSYFSVDNAGATGNVLATLSGLSSDIDLYVGEGSEPGLEDFVCRSWIAGTSNETCGVSLNAGGTVIGVYGYQAGSFTLSLSSAIGATNVSIPFSGNNSVGSGVWKYYKVTNSTAYAAVVADLTGLSADGDLYLKSGALPSLTDFDCRSFASGTSNESCSLDTDGDVVYVGVYGYNASNYTLTLTGSNAVGRKAQDRLPGKFELTQDLESKGLLSSSNVGVGAGAGSLVLPLLGLVLIARRRSNLVKAASLLLAAVTMTVTAGSAHSSELFSDPAAFAAKAPDFKQTVLNVPLLDQTGEAFRLSDFAGKTVLVNFIFTGCSRVCPLQTHELSKVQDRVTKAGLQDQVQFVSITITPESDPPAAMKMFARNHHVDQNNWHFATGNSADIHQMGETLWVGVKPGSNGQTDHRSLLYLVGPNGLLLQRYRGEPVDIDRVSRELGEVVELFNRT